MILRADARAIPLRDGCVDCCVTSPPYFGLRDYGTARWDGGDPVCDHRGPVMQSPSSTLRGNGHGGGKPLSPYLQSQTVPFVAVCGKCGAQRIDAQIGLEPTPDAYVAVLVAVFREVRRVLKDDGTVWLNLGDWYAGGGGFAPDAPSNSVDGRRERGARDCIAGRKVGGIKAVGDLKAKDLLGIPWRVAFALQADGWYLRSDIIWAKPNPMPESVTDRPTKAHEYVFLLAKSARYYYDAAAIAERLAVPAHSPGQTKISTDRNDGDRNTRVFGINGTRNKRSVWTVNTLAYAGAHFATMPEALIRPCILAGCPAGGVVLDPFLGSGTVGAVAERCGRRWVGTDLTYHGLSTARTAQRGLLFV